MSRWLLVSIAVAALLGAAALWRAHKVDSAADHTRDRLVNGRNTESAPMSAPESRAIQSPDPPRPEAIKASADAAVPAAERAAQIAGSQ